VTVFVAGGSGTIGVPLVRALVKTGHHVIATTRSPAKQTLLGELGATPAVVDVLDADAIDRTLRAASPTYVIHELTALPKAGPRRGSDLTATNRLRDQGTRNLLHAAIAAGAKRFIAGSFAPIGAAPAMRNPGGDIQAAAVAVRSMESQILDAARRGDIEGIVLRYGLFYGPDNPATRELIQRLRRRRLPTIRNDRGRLPFIHLDDAASATVAALDRGSSGTIYDIVDDDPISFSMMVEELAAIAGLPRPVRVPERLLRILMPFMARQLSIQLQLSNAKARAELDWRPKFPSYREGLRQTLQPAA
jgi:2-alkyl-3-oxoalkanoate reductase